MVEAKRSLSRTKPRDYTRQLYALARYYAREAAKDRIRHAGKRISDYLPREITAMAEELVEQELQFMARAFGTLISQPPGFYRPSA
jgi:hypothetical protein